MSTTDELWQTLTDTLNALEDAGESINFGSRQGSETGWYSVPYVVSIRRSGLQVTWDQDAHRWRRVITLAKH
ncbi:hypothetical protein ABZ464_02855 [Streptomyces sp. NPDC005820]|uniref:hypothetical protein n=1 Tax=Streptomyces sp. NPDC005820 TaxID=3157069 RepID=UPI0033F9493D